MIYTPLTYRAMDVAYRAHHGQKDRGGAPYIFHPLHLAEQMNDEYTVCAALLHDVVEDTSVTLADLEAMFPPEVTQAVALLTHADGEDYFEYVRRISRSPIARAVKMADLRHNLDASRLPPGQRDLPQSLNRREKYLQALSMLESQS